MIDNNLQNRNASNWQQDFPESFEKDWQHTKSIIIFIIAITLFFVEVGWAVYNGLTQ